MKKREAGTVFILSLWVLLFLAILALGSGAGIRRQIISVKRAEESRIYQDAACSGVLYIVQDIAVFFEKKEQANCDSLNELWANNPDIYSDLTIGDIACSYRYAYRDNATDKDDLWYGVVDEERKLNINYATEDMLVRLLVDRTELSGNKASFLARNIIDWRDVDNVFQEGYRAFSEKDYYKNKGYGYYPSNRPFAVLEELLLVCGMEADIFLNISDYITVFGTGSVNINTASKPVLLALGMGNGLADKIITYRSGHDQTEGTVDDRLFLSKNSFQEDIANLLGLTRDEKRQIDSLVARVFIDTSSSCFRAVCSVSAQGDYKPRAVSVVVFDKSGNIKYYGYKRV
jgi:type II secretory pathway component PulK